MTVGKVENTNQFDKIFEFTNNLGWKCGIFKIEEREVRPEYMMSCRAINAPPPQ